MIHRSQSSQQAQQTPATKQLPGGYVALGAPELPPEGTRFLALVLSPDLEVGMLAVREGETSQSYQYISADVALLVLDTLLSHLWDVLPHASPNFVRREEARLMRLKTAYACMEIKRDRQRMRADDQQQ